MRVPFLVHSSNYFIQDGLMAAGANISRLGTVAGRAQYLATGSLKVSSVRVTLLASSTEYMFGVESTIVDGNHVGENGLAAELALACIWSQNRVNCDD
jgi:hypothetical protein